MNDTVHLENGYESRHLAELLDISDSTLRKWRSTLEKQGYQFSRDSKENRIYTDQDIIALQMLKKITHGRKMTIEKGALAVVQQLVQEGVDEATALPMINKVDERSSERYDEVILEVSRLKEYIQQQAQIMKEQTEIMRNQHQTIELLVQRMDIHDRSIQSNQQFLLNQVKEELAAARRSWWRLW